MSQNTPTKQINFFQITPIFQEDISFSKVINLSQNTHHFSTKQTKLGKKYEKSYNILCICIS